MNRLRSHAVMIVSVSLLLAGCFGGGGGGKPVDPKVLGAYSHSLHAAFYRAWTPPGDLAAPAGRITVPVDVVIDQSGQVRSFNIAERSPYPALDASIKAVGRKITQVDPPPAPAKGGRFRLRINFDLDVRR